MPSVSAPALPCPSCGREAPSAFHTVRDVPVHSVVLIRDRDEALSYPRGDIVLAFCRACGHITNLAFDARAVSYAVEYESTQAFSPTFSAFIEELAGALIERYDLRGKTIVEIGCGNGEFLTLLCEMGGNYGVGFDPAYDGSRAIAHPSDSATFVADYYSERTAASVQADFVCCKMTLEHVHDTAAFVSMVRGTLPHRPETLVFFQVPDTTRILREVAFWDIYYEHCSYFAPYPLVRLFEHCGFEIIDLWPAYDDQYLMLVGRPAPEAKRAGWQTADSLESLAAEVEHFAVECAASIEAWRALITRWRTEGAQLAVWGAGSKAVAFLTTLNMGDEIGLAVDVNPHKHGTYLPGTGQPVVGPGELAGYRPDIVIAMNPIYEGEIRQSLLGLGLGDARLLSLGAAPPQTPAPQRLGLACGAGPVRPPEPERVGGDSR